MHCLLATKIFRRHLPNIFEEAMYVRKEIFTRSLPRLPTCQRRWSRQQTSYVLNKACCALDPGSWADARFC